MRRILYVLVVAVFSGNVWAQKPTLEENIGARTYETIKNPSHFQYLPFNIKEIQHLFVIQQLSDEKTFSNCFIDWFLCQTRSSV
jgi:hypothetical protein